MIKSIAFDLDDTLIDTSGLLVPAASREAFDKMSALKLECSFKEFDRERHLLTKQFPHREIFPKLARRWSKESDQFIASVAEHAIFAFYNPTIPRPLPLLPGALENLTQLTKYNLYLVTAGSKKAQLEKISASGLEPHFKKVFLVDGAKGERKKVAFEQIISSDQIQPNELLCFGNRLGQEIRDGKMAGAMTCHFVYGEHMNELPQIPEDNPDYVIHEHSEFIKTCRL